MDGLVDDTDAGCWIRLRTARGVQIKQTVRRLRAGRPCLKGFNEDNYIELTLRLETSIIVNLIQVLSGKYFICF